MEAGWERVSVGDVLERLRWSVPDQEAIVGLLARGLGPGDRVMLQYASTYR